MKYLLGLVALSTVLVASTAYADGMPEPYTPPVVLKPYNWSGAYIGGHFGWAWTDVDVFDVVPYNPLPNNFSYDLDGPFGGVQAGYNMQSGSIVYGIEGELGYLALDGSGQAPSRVGIPGDSISSVDGGIYGTIAGRVGFAADGFLVYGKAGWGFADVDASYTDDNAAGGFVLVSGTSRDETINAPVYGGGVEFAVTSTATFKVEYLRLDFDETVTVRATDNFEDRYRFKHDIDAIDTVKVGFNIKLGRERLREPLK